ncbi:MAG: hypothetical protein ACYTXC_06490 [Nostoc sp.]
MFVKQLRSPSIPFVSFNPIPQILPSKRHPQRDRLLTFLLRG